MFKNLIVYRIAQGWAPTHYAVNDALAATPFMECGARHPVNQDGTPVGGALPCGR